MPFYDAAGVRINYEIHGEGNEGPPILLIAPGGMNSTIQRWDVSPWHPITNLASEFTTIAMDQRNAGASFAPVGATDGWDVYRNDQLGLLDHLGIDRCHLLGMCIGGPYIFGLLAAEPERFCSAVILQPVGVDAANRSDFFEISRAWADELKGSPRADVPDEVWDSYFENMWGGDFVRTATVEEISRMPTPMLIFMGNDSFHPEHTSREIAAHAPNATLIEEWKDPARIDAVDARIKAFLRQHSD